MYIKVEISLSFLHAIVASRSNKQNDCVTNTRGKTQNNCYNRLFDSPRFCNRHEFPVVTHLFWISNFICSQTHPTLLFSGLGPLFLLFILLFSRPILFNLTRGAWRLIGHHKGIRKLTFRTSASRRNESRNCVWFASRMMELLCLLVHGNVTNNNKLVEWVTFVDTVRIKPVPIWKINFCSGVLRLSVL